MDVDDSWFYNWSFCLVIRLWPNCGWNFKWNVIGWKSLNSSLLTMFYELAYNNNVALPLLSWIIVGGFSSGMMFSRTCQYLLNYLLVAIGVLWEGMRNSVYLNMTLCGLWCINVVEVVWSDTCDWMLIFEVIKNIWSYFCFIMNYVLWRLLIIQTFRIIKD